MPSCMIIPNALPSDRVTTRPLSELLEITHICYIFIAKNNSNHLYMHTNKDFIDISIKKLKKN